ncbi:MAG: efflux RND transporter periplasmic adaptor subunit [Peptococcaceae bacterium]|jgi:HlyD family secretion protein|nr:efflux RND transporter periplasmic adaptor subunit [Peptococcaceae bacterium]
MRKTVVYTGVGLLLAAGAVVLVLNRSGTPVKMVTVEPGSITSTVQDTGYVRPVQKYDLDATTGTAGTVEKVVQVAVARGQQVTQGQVLVRLQDQNLDAQTAQAAAGLSQAEAALASTAANLEDTLLAYRQARRDFTRTRQLYASGADPRQELEQGQTALDTARENWREQNSLQQQEQARVDSLQQSYQDLAAEEGQLVITSPVAGTVLDLPAKIDEAVAPGSPLATVAGAKGLEVKADILTDDMADVRVGQTATVTAPALGTTVLTGKVAEIYPQAVTKQSALGEVQRRVPVIVTLPVTARLESGYKVRVAVDTATVNNVLVVPRESVRTAPDGRQEVMAVVGGRVQYTDVTTGLSDTGNVAVTGGLEAGEVIVKDATRDIADGARVSAAP